MTTFGFFNGFLVLCKHLTCERLLSHQVKNLEKNERRQYLVLMFMPILRFSKRFQVKVYAVMFKKHFDKHSLYKVFTENVY